MTIQNGDYSGHSDTAIYRADIDGLRAIAVLLVIGYHAFPAILKSGFIGVDIFFVISGYLITSIVAEDIRSKKFSLGRFYQRRINRLLPALLLVMIASLTAGWFSLLPNEYKQLGKHSAAGAAFISNLVFWSEAGYFDTAADSKVLLHLWSLAVEEQFYFVWPVLILFSWRGQFRQGTICILLITVSLFLNIKTVDANQTAAFFSPLTRFWELLSGAMLSILVHPKSRTIQAGEATVSNWIDLAVYQAGHLRKRPTVNDAAALLGATLIAVAVAFLPANARFPGKWALLPVIGTWLVIYGGPDTWLARKVLSSRMLVFVGLISYPLYLWHWPLLTFSRHLSEQTPSKLLLCGIVICSAVLAWLTYLLVERPIRHRANQSRSAAVLLLIMAFVGAFGLYVATHDGIRSRMHDKKDYAKYFESSSDEKSDPLAVEREESAQNRCNRYFVSLAWGDVRPRQKIDEDCYTKHTAKSVLIWGDSHAAHLYHGLKKTLPQDVSTLLMFSSGCGPRPIDRSRVETDHCELSNYSALNLAEREPPDVVVLASSTSFDIEYVRALTTQLRSFGVKKVLVAGSLPRWQPALYKTVLNYYWLQTPKRISGHQDLDKLSPDLKFRAQIRSDDKFEYINLFDFFCNSAGCMTYLGNNKREGLITFDEAHLRPFASEYLAERLLTPLILKGMGDVSK